MINQEVEIGWRVFKMICMAFIIGCLLGAFIMWVLI